MDLGSRFLEYGSNRGVCRTIRLPSCNANIYHRYGFTPNILNRFLVFESALTSFHAPICDDRHGIVYRVAIACFM